MRCFYFAHNYAAIGIPLTNKKKIRDGRNCPWRAGQIFPIYDRKPWDRPGFSRKP
jgi:hypothetical protein